MNPDDRLAELERENAMLRELAEMLLGPHAWAGYQRGLQEQQHESTAPA